MDKETLSKYGWVVIVIIILVILMSFAAPFGQYFYDSTMKMVETLKNSTNIEQLFTPNNPSTEDNKTTTNYTLEQIEADEHLYAIGYTNPEDVVAVFNENYTEVEIYKNGENSDGMMKWFYNEDYTGSEITPDIFYSSPMSDHSDTLVTAKINNGVTCVGIGAFAYCDNLTEVLMSTSVQDILHYAFYDCSSLKSIKIPSQDELYDTNTDKYTDYAVLAYYAFAECHSLESVYFGNGVYSIADGLFQNCNSLKRVICSENTVMYSHADGWMGDNNVPSSFDGTSNVIVYGYGKETSTGYGGFSATPYEWAKDHSDERLGGVSYYDVSAEPQLTLEYIAGTKQSQIEPIFNTMKNDMIKPIADAFNLSYTSALHFALLCESGKTEDDALAIVNQGEEYSRTYINNNCIYILSDGNVNIKTIDDWFYVNTGVHEKDAINYMETGSWDATIFAQIYADEIKSDINSLVSEYDISYYSAVLIWIDKDVTYKEFTLAQQSESELESYVNSYYKELFKSESGDNSIDTADEYFKHKLGKTAHDIAYYIENGNWPA